MRNIYLYDLSAQFFNDLLIKFGLYLELKFIKKRYKVIYNGVILCF